MHERRERLIFLEQLRDSMGRRFGLVFGGTEQLGVLPLLVALYLQFKDWRFGDWAAAFDVHVVGGLLIWAMALLYAAGWLLLSLRVRLLIYLDVLRESLSEP